MNTPIDLDTKLSLFAIKICNKAFDNLLSPEFKIPGFPVAKLGPQLLFGRSHFPSKNPGLNYLDIRDRLKLDYTAASFTRAHL